jgi:hypothetical protein
MPYKDPEKARECKRRWKQRNKEKVRADRRLYCKRHPDRLKEQRKRWLANKWLAVTSRRCNKCGKVKPTSSFHLGASACKPCVIKKTREWYTKNHDRAKAVRDAYREANREYLNAHKRKKLAEMRANPSTAPVVREKARKKAKRAVDYLHRCYITGLLRAAGVKNPPPALVDVWRMHVGIKRVLWATRRPADVIANDVLIGQLLRESRGDDNRRA